MSAMESRLRGPLTMKEVIYLEAGCPGIFTAAAASVRNPDRRCRCWIRTRTRINSCCTSAARHPNHLGANFPRGG